MPRRRPASARHALQALDLDSPFDRLTAVASAMFDAPHAMISVIDGARTLFRANLGLGVDEMPRDLTLSSYMVAQGPDTVIVVEDGRTDPRTANHVMVTGAPFLRFFIGATISDRRGRAIGAIGVMDTQPRTGITEAEIANVRLLARMAGDLVEQADAVRYQSERLELLRLAEEMAGVGQWQLDPVTGMVAWSDEVYRIHGVDLGSFDPSYDDAVSFYHPEDRPVLMAAIAHSLAEGVGYRMRVRLIRADGVERIVETHADCERGPDGAVSSLFGVFRDVTEETKAQERIAESERRYRLLADRATDIIMIHGVDGTLTYASPSLEPVTGHRAEDVLGKPSLEMIEPEDRVPIVAAYAEARRDRSIERIRPLRYRSVSLDGRVRWFESRATPIRDEDGRVVEFHDVSREITQTKALEDELVEARDRAEDGARAKSEFLSNMSHELRTPLTSVIGFAGLLKDSPTLSDLDRRHVERIALASDSLLGVINDILDYSKLEAGAVSIDPQAFDPRAMAQGAVSIVEGACQAKGLAVRIRIDPSLPAFLLGDEARLRQVVLNFLSNAVKFTSDGGITVGLDWNGGRMRVSVADTGIGVAPDKLAGLFQRFTQADNSTSRLYGGTGLGLSISRRLVEMMGGQIGADSRAGKGSTFWFEAPFEMAAATHVRVPDGAGAVAPEGLRVLMADDAPANRELVGAILGGMGMTVETVEDGVQAVEAARIGGFDLVLMDVHMPNMDGLDATRAIRGLGGAVAGVPIIALTANVQPEQVARCREAGMDAHVGKPIAVAELVRAMVGCLEQAQPADAAARGVA